MKAQYIEKYPNCWDVLCDIKGGYHCRDYGDFAVLLQETEAEIFYDNVNVKLLEQGIHAFNIYDSVYVNNEKDYQLVNRLILDFFAKLDITPTLKPEYYGRNEVQSDPGNQILDQIEIAVEHKPEPELTPDEQRYIDELNELSRKNEESEKEEERHRQYNLNTSKRDRRWW